MTRLGGRWGGVKKGYPNAGPVGVALQPGAGLVDVGHVPGPDTAAHLHGNTVCLLPVHSDFMYMLHYFIFG